MDTFQAVIFVDSELVNREIVNSANNQNNYIDNINSLNIVNTYCVNNFYDRFQSDACNSNIDHETRGDNKSSRSQMFFKIGVLENFAYFTGKQLC